MKTVVKTGVNGKKITLLVPETEEDLKTIKGKEETGTIDSNVGFADSRNQCKQHDGKKSTPARAYAGKTSH